MNVGFVGLGKLGLPVALAVRGKGHAVVGHDLAQDRMDAARAAGLATGALADVARQELVFVAVQTPHGPEYEGVTRLPADRADFFYGHLRHAVARLVEHVRPGSDTCVAVVSTVLPGTSDRDLKPVLGGVPYVYNPSFIAMGTVERDYLHPEFVLLGCDSLKAEWVAESFYRQTVEAPIIKMSVRDAELTKVAYNTFIGLKLAFANTMLELCHKTGCDVDAVLGALRMANKRLTSPAYLSAGMGDGGGCHPRDNIALSHLARQAGLSYDLFEAVMLARERQAEWLADLMCAHDLPKAICGVAYKAGTDITTGSHALLVKTILEDRGEDVATFDDATPLGPAVVLIGTNDRRWQTTPFAPGSVVYDPWRIVPDQEGVDVHRLGQRNPGVPRLRQPAAH